MAQKHANASIRPVIVLEIIIWHVPCTPIVRIALGLHIHITGRLRPVQAGVRRPLKSRACLHMVVATHTITDGACLLTGIVAADACIILHNLIGHPTRTLSC